MKKKIFLKKTLILLDILILLFFLNLESKAQAHFGAGGTGKPDIPDEISQGYSASHYSSTSESPDRGSSQITAKDGYYITSITFSTDNQPTCAWCRNTSTIGQYGLTATISRFCDGGPCELHWVVVSKRMYLDATIIKISKDNDENLSSGIWAENKSGNDITLVYKYQVYQNGGYTSSYTSATVPAFNKVRIMPRYIRNGTELYEQFLTPLYLK